jgi:hypothetical protein
MLARSFTLDSDKVVSLLDKIQNVRHGNPLNRFAALETHLNGIA